MDFRSTPIMTLRYFWVALALASVSPPAHCAENQLPPIPAPHYRVVPSVLTKTENVVAALTDVDLHLDRTGAADTSSNIQRGLDAIGAAGGGTLFLARGTYRLNNPLSLPPAVTLRGEIAPTSNPYRYQGTMLAAYAGRGEVAGKPLITLETCAGARSLLIWYPEQKPAAIVPYPPAFWHHSSSTTVDNVVLINAYQGYRSGYNMTGRPYVRGLRGTALAIGIEIDAIADTGRIENVRLSPEYWAQSGLPGSPVSRDQAYRRFMRERGIGIYMRRNDWTVSANVNVAGYKIGFYSAYSIADENLKKGNTKGTPNGSNFGFNIRDCRYAVFADGIAGSGMMFTRCHLQGDDAAIYLGAGFQNIVTILDSTLASPETSLVNRGSGHILVRDSVFERGTLLLDGGYLSCANTRFAAGTCTLRASDQVQRAAFFGCAFGRPLLSLGAQTVATVSDAPVPTKIAYNYPLPAFDRRCVPRGVAFCNVLDLGAAGDGKTDCTAAFRSALAKAGGAGGGTVFVPPGSFLVTQPLTVPTGVELRGVFDVSHDTSVMGSTIFAECGKGVANGAPLLTLQAHSGVRGLNFHYPGQDMEHLVDYPFTMRGQGAGVYVVDTSTSNASRYLDLMTNRCDDFYVDRIEGQPLRIGVAIGGGSRNGFVANAQFNPSNWAWSKIYANSPWVLYRPQNPARYDDLYHAYEDYMRSNCEVFVLGDCSGLVFHQNFVFAGRYGLHAIAQNGRGPSGASLGLGVDQCHIPVRLDAIGAGGFPFINSQLVGGSKLDEPRTYVWTGPEFTGTGEFYGLNAWGGSVNNALTVDGGVLRVDGANLRDARDLGWKVSRGQMLLTASQIGKEVTAQTAPGASVTTVANLFPTSLRPVLGMASTSDVFSSDRGQATPGKTKVLAEPERGGVIMVSSERDEKGGGGRRFTAQGEWNYPGVWTTPGPEKRAVWEASLPQAGLYRVEMWFEEDPNQDHATNATVRIESADGERRASVNQRQHTREWTDLGTSRFKTGELARVILEAKDAGGNPIADIVRFTPVSSAAPK